MAEEIQIDLDLAGAYEQAEHMAEHEYLGGSNGSNGSI